jgi:xylulokinase
MYLGIDCGTQGTKAVVVGSDGSILGRGHSRYSLIEGAGGAREQKPCWWVEAMFTAASQALENIEPKSVRGMAVSGQQHGLVILDERMQVIRPAKLWNDTQTAPQNLELIERSGGAEQLYEEMGIVPLTGYTVSKLLWVAESEPENFRRIRHILLPHEYLNYVLTGRMCSEYGDASGTGYFDIRNRTWNRTLLNRIDGGSDQLCRALPELIGPGDVVGTVLPAVASRLGVSEQCLVAPGGGDNMMAAIGTGNVTEGVVTMSLGTSSTVYAYNGQPLACRDTAVAPFCSSTGGWLPLVCTMNATNVVTQVLDLVGHSVSDLDEALKSTRPGADGLTFLAYLNGERTPDLPGASGSIFGLTSTNLSAFHLLRATVEGVSFGILDGLRRIVDPKSCTEIILVGGGAKSAGWRQMIADASGIPVCSPSEEEAGALGAAMQAMHVDLGDSFEDLAARCVRFDSSKTAQPNAGAKQLYVDAQQRYLQFRRMVHGV